MVPTPFDPPDPVPPSRIAPDPARTADYFGIPRGDPTATAATPDGEPDAEPLPDLPLPALAGRYLLQSEWTRGGMGVLYRAFDTHFECDCLLKALLPDHGRKPLYRRRFQTEMHLTARLEHPGVVPVYDHGELPDGRPFFAMRQVPGRTLAELIADGPARPGLLKVFEQACQAVAYAHAQGVLHRDLKPENVIVGPFGVVKVLDWGVAKVLSDGPMAARMPVGHVAPAEVPGGLARLADDPERTVSGAIVGTLAYMSPEQVGGLVDRVDRRSDVFGLGAILCQLLTGLPPYTGDTPNRILRRALKADLGEAVERLRKCQAEPELIALAERCLAADQDHRPADAAVVVQVLTEHFESELRRAERDLVRFFELSLDLFCLADFTGHLRRVNGNFARLLGFEEREFLSQPFLNFVHEEDRARTTAVMGDLMHGKPVVRFRNRYRDATGNYHWLEWTAKAVRESGEGLIFAVARDVTDGFRSELEG